MYRSLTDSKVWNLERYSKGQAWVDLLLLANHEPNTFFLRGIEVNLDRGQLAYSQVSLSKKWKWNERTVNRFISWLEKEQMIQSRKSNVSTIITILNYSRYQQTTEQSTEQHTDRIQSKVQTNKNDKNVKNIDITNVISSNVPDINRLIGLFSTVNPSYKQLFPQKSQRQALERMIDEHGLEKVEWAVKSLPHVVGKQYAPTITTPYELEKKLGSLIAYLQKEQGAINKFSVTKL